ncbi:hypothetical protein B0H11DRAFT_2202601 [Mycena galericulata]|nr:hypothetical protein B0H11DRAFT_2202601 [Mycena galericulata]
MAEGRDQTWFLVEELTHPSSFDSLYEKKARKVPGNDGILSNNLTRFCRGRLSLLVFTLRLRQSTGKHPKLPERHSIAYESASHHWRDWIRSNPRTRCNYQCSGRSCPDRMFGNPTTQPIEFSGCRCECELPKHHGSRPRQSRPRDAHSLWEVGETMKRWAWRTKAPKGRPLNGKQTETSMNRTRAKSCRATLEQGWYLSSKWVTVAIMPDLSDEAVKRPDQKPWNKSSFSSSPLSESQTAKDYCFGLAESSRVTPSRGHKCELAVNYTIQMFSCPGFIHQISSASRDKFEVGCDRQREHCRRQAQHMTDRNPKPVSMHHPPAFLHPSSNRDTVPKRSNGHRGEKSGRIVHRNQTAGPEHGVQNEENQLSAARKKVVDWSAGFA